MHPCLRHAFFPVTFPATLLLLAALFAPTVVHAQDAESHSGQPQEPGMPLLGLDEIETVFFTPKHIHRAEMINLAQRLHGRQIFVYERGGYNAQPVQNLQTLGDSILIYDEPEYAARLVTWMTAMDRPADLIEQARQKTDVIQWSPGYVSLPTAQQALRAFERVLTLDTEEGTQRVANVTSLPDQNVLVLRDTADQLAQMNQLLASIDKPEPQLRVTALVITAHHGSGGESELPKSLSDHLSQLVPYDRFEISSMGLVRTSSRSNSIELNMTTGDRFDLRPDAYDAKTGTLSARIQFQSASDFKFETRTSLVTDEYVVIGASGAEPTFAVLRIEALDG